MRGNFENCMTFVLRHEGRFSQDPDDTGGATNYGISLRFARSIHLDLDGDGETTVDDIRLVTPTVATQLYREHFWSPLFCDLIPEGVDLVLVDGAINQGVNRLARLLQRSLGLVDDGVLGPVSQAAMGALAVHPELHQEVLLSLAWRRAKKYSEAATVNRHGNGWYRRLFEAYDASLTMLGSAGKEK